MTFLELCQEVRRECGIAGTGPTTTVSQTGMLLKVVEWTNKAYQDIQRLRNDWRFRQTTKSFNTIASTGEYLSEMSDVFDITTLSCYLNDVSNEAVLKYLPYELFYRKYLVGTQTSNRPTHYSIAPNCALAIGPNPNDIYTLNLKYTQTIDVLDGNTDVPIIPTDYQDAIVWKACMYFGKYRENPMSLQLFKDDYQEILARMELELRPRVYIDAAVFA